MPYNTRRKSLSLPSLGIHIPVSQAARAAAAAAAATASPAKVTARSSSTFSSSTFSSSSSATGAALHSKPTTSPSHNRSQSMDHAPSKRVKRSHSDPAATKAIVTEPTPPASLPSKVNSTILRDIDLSSIHDDIVEAVVIQLQRTANRPHLIKELALVLALQLKSVQNSANQCAIISSRLASYMKRPVWSDDDPCPIAKELEPAHPRRTYYFLTTSPRQPLPDSNAIPVPQPPPISQIAQPQQPFFEESLLTPSVSLTDDSGSDDLELRRRDLSPSPEVELAAPEFDDFDDDLDLGMPATPIGSFPKSYTKTYDDLRNNTPPLEKDEREFTQTAGKLQKRKWSDSLAVTDLTERPSPLDYGYRGVDDSWFGESRILATNHFASPLIKPSGSLSARKEADTDHWAKLNDFVVEWDKGAESIEIDELDCLLDAC